MKYLSNQPIVFGSEGSEEYCASYERIFGAKADEKECKQGEYFGAPFTTEDND